MLSRRGCMLLTAHCSLSLTHTLGGERWRTRRHSHKRREKKSGREKSATYPESVARAEVRLTVDGSLLVGWRWCVGMSTVPQRNGLSSRPLEGRHRKKHVRWQHAGDPRQLMMAVTLRHLPATTRGANHENHSLVPPPDQVRAGVQRCRKQQRGAHRHKRRPSPHLTTSTTAAASGLCVPLRHPPPPASAPPPPRPPSPVCSVEASLL